MFRGAARVVKSWGLPTCAPPSSGAPTNGILEVFLSNQLEILLYGFGGQGVLPKNEVFAVHETVHFRHGHVGQEVLPGRGRREAAGAVLLLPSQGSGALPLGPHSPPLSLPRRTLALPVLWRICTRAQATSSLLLTLRTGSSTAHSMR